LFWPLSIVLTFFYNHIGPGLKILCMKFVRTVGSVHVVIILCMKFVRTVGSVHVVIILCMKFVRTVGSVHVVIILCMKFVRTVGSVHVIILCMKFVRTVGSVHVVIIPSITAFQTDKNLTVYTATVLFLVLQDDASDKQQTMSDNFKVRHPFVFSYN
jgi:hypothetical protein